MHPPHPRHRTFPALLARLLLVRVTAWAALSSALLVGQTLGTAMTSQGSTGLAEDAPAWTPADTRAFPGCVPARRWEPDRIPARIVVHRNADERHLAMSLDRAWHLNHNDTEVDDVHVIGSCH